ncbi:unnamed protein product [Orchesella dallaii]|uniref:DUF7153 domain-containing protein n=1 Tax=Orchesella dallaii TaxID=48710 RepID=A0ABP1PU05_9HEXA
MSGEEFRTMIGGSSSSCYSTTSSNSSSVENISTSSSIENGDQLTITFVPRKVPSLRSLSPFLEDVFSIDDICFGDRVSPVQKTFRGSPSWYSDINSAASPTLKTVTNDDESGSSSSSGYSQAIQNLSGDGILLKSLEKGASFPYLHLSTSSLCVSPTGFQEEQRDVKQGVYKEIKRVVPPDSWITKNDSHQDQGKSTWLFLGFKTLDKNNEVLEQSWKEWTGVRHLYLELRTDIHIRRISFFRRQEPHDCLDTFAYVVFLEIGSVSVKTNTWLLDFVQRTRLDRMQSTMTVYEEVELWEADSGIPQA